MKYIKAPRITAIKSTQQQRINKIKKEVIGYIIFIIISVCLLLILCLICDRYIWLPGTIL